MHTDEVSPDFIVSYIVRTWTAANISVVNQLQERYLVMVQVANTAFSYMQLHKQLLPESISLSLIFFIGHAPRVCNKQEHMLQLHGELAFVHILALEVRLTLRDSPISNSTAIVMHKIIVYKSQLESQISYPLDQYSVCIISCIVSFISQLPMHTTIMQVTP